MLMFEDEDADWVDIADMDDSSDLDSPTDFDEHEMNADDSAE